jgi:NAD(P)-dependent dehydrogenase (short-subunit alcohol dehydrogenase family)
MPFVCLAGYRVAISGAGALVRATVAELGAAGIRIDAIRPGMTRSAKTGAMFDNPEMLTPLVEAIFGAKAIAALRAGKNPDQT